MLGGIGRRALPGARGATPLSVSVTLHRLIEQRQSSGLLPRGEAQTG
jgi:hypothetical protein